MRVTSIEYSQLFSTGNYTNQKIGVVVEVQEGENEAEAMLRAQKFVRQFCPDDQITEQQYRRAQEIVDNPSRYMYDEVERAKITVKTYLNRKDEDSLRF